MNRLRRWWEISERGGLDVSIRLWIGPDFPFLGFHLHVEFVDDFDDTDA